MPTLHRYRVYATATHCAVTEIEANSAEEEAEIAGKLDVDEFDILHVHADSVKIEKVILVLDAEHMGADELAASPSEH